MRSGTHGRALVVTLLSLAGAAGSHANEGDPPRTPVTVTESVEYVPLPARTLEHAVALIQGSEPMPDGRPKPEFNTEGALSLGYKLTPLERGGCRLENVAVGITITTRIPRWAPPENARADVRERWAKVDEGMHAHERGHRNNLVTMAEDLRNRLLALAAEPAPDCESHARAILRAQLAAQTRHQTRDQAYDRLTRHGENQTRVPIAEPPSPHTDLRRRGRDRDGDGKPDA